MTRKRQVALAIICAKSRELRCVQRELKENPNFSKISDNDSEFTQLYEFKRKSVEGEVAQTLRLRVSTCGAMGHMAAAIHTGQVIAESEPTILFFVGTAASVEPEKIQLGDVVIPDASILRIHEKISEKGQEDYEKRIKNGGDAETFMKTNVFCAQERTKELHKRIDTLLSAVEFDDVELYAGEGTSITLGEDEFPLRAPKVHSEDVDIFSCGMVIDSISYRDFLKERFYASYRKAGIIDMESYGFYAAIEAAKDTSSIGFDGEGVMVRGISDYAGRKKETEKRPDGWKDLAVQNAARVVIKIISDTYC